MNKIKLFAVTLMASLIAIGPSFTQARAITPYSWNPGTADDFDRLYQPGDIFDGLNYFGGGHYTVGKEDYFSNTSSFATTYDYDGTTKPAPSNTNYSVKVETYIGDAVSSQFSSPTPPAIVLSANHIHSTKDLGETSVVYNEDDIEWRDYYAITNHSLSMVKFQLYSSGIVAGERYELATAGADKTFADTFIDDFKSFWEVPASGGPIITYYTILPDQCLILGQPWANSVTPTYYGYHLVDKGPVAGSYADGYADGIQINDPWGLIYNSYEDLSTSLTFKFTNISVLFPYQVLYGYITGSAYDLYVNPNNTDQRVLLNTYEGTPIYTVKRASLLNGTVTTTNIGEVFSFPADANLTKQGASYWALQVMHQSNFAYTLVSTTFDNLHETTRGMGVRLMNHAGMDILTWHELGWYIGQSNELVGNGGGLSPEESFMTGLQGWIVPAIIVVIVGGGIFGIISARRKAQGD
jgi:hypothetical protein